MTWHYWAFIALMTFLGFAAGWEFATRRVRKRFAERMGYDPDPPFLRIRKVDERPALYFFIFAGMTVGGVALLAFVLLLALGRT